MSAVARTRARSSNSALCLPLPPGVWSLELHSSIEPRDSSILVIVLNAQFSKPIVLKLTPFHVLFSLFWSQNLHYFILIYRLFITVFSDINFKKVWSLPSFKKMWMTSRETKLITRMQNCALVGPAVPCVSHTAVASAVAAHRQRLTNPRCHLSILFKCASSRLANQDIRRSLGWEMWSVHIQNVDLIAMKITTLKLFL